MRQDPSREISENLHLVKITHYTVKPNWCAPCMPCVDHCLKGSESFIQKSSTLTESSHRKHIIWIAIE